jgi:hypothetical protein
VPKETRPEKVPKTRLPDRVCRSRADGDEGNEFHRETLKIPYDECPGSMPGFPARARDFEIDFLTRFAAFRLLIDQKGAILPALAQSDSWRQKKQESVPGTMKKSRQSGLFRFRIEM